MNKATIAFLLIIGGGCLLAVAFYIDGPIGVIVSMSGLAGVFASGWVFGKHDHDMLMKRIIGLSLLAIGSVGMFAGPLISLFVGGTGGVAVSIGGSVCVSITIIMARCDD